MELASDLGIALAGSAMAYTMIACLALRWRIRPTSPVSTSRAPVTVLKPVCGHEPELYENLRTFCDQAYPQMQIVFGLSDAKDPAVAVVRRLQQEFSSIQIDIVIDPTQHGSSRKVSNLINMMRVAHHDLLVIADSDIRVERDYLSKVAAPLADPSVGIVTCSYRGCPEPGVWSQLGSLFINEWFIPSVRVSALLSSRSFAFGATIALRRDVLSRIGGFAAIADELADDYRLGELTRDIGLRTVLSDVIVETSVHERTLTDLIRHELRWLRTIRAVRPVGYAMCFVTFGVPIAALGALLASGSPLALAILGATALSRLLLHRAARPVRIGLSRLWILPFHDVLEVGLWVWGFSARHVHWREDRLQVMRDGSVRAIGTSA